MIVTSIIMHIIITIVTNITIRIRLITGIRLMTSSKVTLAINFAMTIGFLIVTKALIDITIYIRFSEIVISTSQSLNINIPISLSCI